MNSKHLCVEGRSHCGEHRELHYAHRHIVPSGLDFEDAGDSVVRYFMCNYLLRGIRAAVNMTWALFRAETVERELNMTRRKQQLTPSM